MIASAVFLASALTALSAPIALENGALEIQVQPETFAIVSFRALTEANFVMPLPVSGDAAQAAEWLDPGGLVTDVLPSGEQDAALRLSSGRRGASFWKDRLLRFPDCGFGRKSFWGRAAIHRPGFGSRSSLLGPRRNACMCAIRFVFPGAALCAWRGGMVPYGL